ncbi:MAG: AI-2E family transporter [Gammaproteobacteria bacterium]
MATESGSIRQAIEIAVSLGLLFAVIAWCWQILRPFASFIVWGGVIAIAAYTPFLSLRRILGGRQKLAVIAFVLIGLALVIGPTFLFAGSLVESARSFGHDVEAGTLTIPAPSAKVQGWPVIGEKLYANWSEASSDLDAWLGVHREQLRTLGTEALKRAAGAGLSVLQFILAIVIAAVFLANADAAASGVQRFCVRAVGERGSNLVRLATATIRSVAVGVLGIAFIQAMLGGLGMMIVGVPAAGLWTLMILVLAVAQLPPLLVLLPVAIYVFSVQSTPIAVAFLVWSVAVSFSDAVLKPLLLGRGVEAPMLVILLGAIGGMILSGIIGLFVGAVVLAVGYKLLEAWLDAGDEPAAADAAEVASVPGAGRG